MHPMFHVKRAGRSARFHINSAFGQRTRAASAPSRTFAGHRHADPGAPLPRRVAQTAEGSGLHTSRAALQHEGMFHVKRLRRPTALSQRQGDEQGHGALSTRARSILGAMIREPPVGRTEFRPLPACMTPSTHWLLSRAAARTQHTARAVSHEHSARSVHRS